VPTPLAHSGFALALALAASPGKRPPLRYTAALIFAANAADLDFVPGILTGQPVAYHHGASHSFLFATLIAAIVTALVPRIAQDPRGAPEPGKFWRWATLAACSHPLLDWVTGETGADVAKYGVALLWPSPVRYMSDTHVFGAYHIDTMGLIGGVLTFGAVLPLLREVGFVALMISLAVGWRRTRSLWSNPTEP
jgi:membrane-bound metal-dependent hydrolase YbcI (DUF457 family)